MGGPATDCAARMLVGKFSHPGDVNPYSVWQFPSTQASALPSMSLGEYHHWDPTTSGFVESWALTIVSTEHVDLKKLGTDFLRPRTSYSSRLTSVTLGPVRGELLERKKISIQKLNVVWMNKQTFCPSWTSRLQQCTFCCPRPGCRTCCLVATNHIRLSRNRR